jgi:hypothetical protein
MKFQRRQWLEDFAWRVERVTQKFRLSSVSFLSVYLFSVTVHIANDTRSLHEYLFHSLTRKVTNSNKHFFNLTHGRLLIS